ncbi:M17 family metallopeptidase [Alphaproteobacteria bacterium LSUCC0684]
MPVVASMPTSRLIFRLEPDEMENWLNERPAAYRRWAKDHDFTAKPGTHLIFPGDEGGIAEVVLGKKDAFVDGARAGGLPKGTYALTSQDEVEEIAIGFLLQQYKFDRFREKASAPTADLVLADDALRHRVEAISAGIFLARDLINMPANYLNPQGMEDAARDLAEAYSADLDVTIGDELTRRFPAIDTVGRAAECPPRLLDLRWGDDGPLITLIGKGVTFDSGGLDLKPSGGMEMMKKDMGGAAHVLGLARIIMALGLKMRLRVLIPTVENAVSSRSMRPLDVIDTAAGIPVEVGNTDAEGRLILADAIYLATQEEPEMLVDFATLTGAARVAVGTELPALFTNDEALGRELVAAGEATGDPVWPLPLHAPYERYLEGGYAALSSTGTSRYGGAITAALFLKRFLARPVPWAHLDVMAWNLGDRPGHPKGGEAMGLRAVFRLIENRLKA